MLLALEDAKLFFKLHHAFLYFVNQRLKVVPNKVQSHEDISSLPPELLVRIRNTWIENVDLVLAFVEENPARLSTDELEIVASWKHQVTGKFYVLKELKKYTVFLSATSPVTAYGVLALSQPFADLIGPRLPVLTQTVLLPFRDVIIYDGLMNSYSISFGPGIRRSLNEDFQNAKANHGIVTSLAMSALPTPPTAPKPKSGRKSKAASKLPSNQEKDESLRLVTGLIDQFCKEHLNEEYSVLCRKLAEKLARKRPSPLLQGRLNAWASGIVRAIGGVNFLHDKTQSPYMRATDIDAYLGTSASSGAAKAAEIRKMFRMFQFAPDWTLPSRLDNNPLTWMLQVNGFMIDVRSAPREAQEIAFRKGLIPYIPADRQERTGLSEDV